MYLQPQLFSMKCAHASYYIVICGLFGSNIFSNIISEMALISGKKFLKTKRVFLFPLLHLSERVLILRRIQLDIIINVHRCSHSVPVILVRS
jgi:hypothetical protein